MLPPRAGRAVEGDGDGGPLVQPDPRAAAPARGRNMCCNFSPVSQESVVSESVWCEVSNVGRDSQ